MAERLCYTIGDVAKEVGEDVSTIRYWSDTFGKWIKPERNAKGNRIFSPSDLEKVRIVHYLTRYCGMTLEGVSRKLSCENAGTLAAKAEALARLVGIREKLCAMHKEILGS